MKPAFEANKIKRCVNTVGTLFDFNRKAKNLFGEFDNDAVQIISLKGVYHQQSSHISVSESTGTRTKSKPIPMILTTWELFEAEPILLDDTVVLNDKKYLVNGVTNIQEGNYGADISLEVIQ